MDVKSVVSNSLLLFTFTISSVLFLTDEEEGGNKKGENIGIQFHGLHVHHGLIKFPSSQKPTASSLCERWYARNGRAKIEPPESIEDVAAYCCKHLTADSFLNSTRMGNEIAGGE